MCKSYHGLFHSARRMQVTSGEHWHRTCVCRLSRFIFDAAIKAVTVLQQQAERETHKPHINALTWTWPACGVRQQASPCRHFCSWGSLVVKTDADIVRIRAARKCKALIYTQMIQRLFHKVTKGVCVHARVLVCDDRSLFVRAKSVIMLWWKFIDKLMSNTRVG